MKILLVAPASGGWQGIGRRRLFNGRLFRFSMLPLLSVAACTPDDVEIRLVDEQVDELPLDEHFDLVGITFMTALAPRAYEISVLFRARGMKTVAGGFHPTFLPDEAARYFDAVVVGEAETTWPRLVADARRGRLGRLYRASEQADLTQLKIPDRSLLKPEHYANAAAVQTGRGCTHGCRFCSVAAFCQYSYRARPIEQVVEEVGALAGRNVLFVDDNIVADQQHAGLLFDSLQPLRKRWISQGTLSAAEKPDLLRRMAASGCRGLFVGLETFSAASLRDLGKDCNRAGRYRDLVASFHDHGIGVIAGIVFGLDRDDVGVFGRTLDLLDWIGIDAIQTAICTPLPGTPLAGELQSRVFDHNWAHYDYRHVVFHPARMTADQLQDGADWVIRQFYRPKAVARRSLAWRGRVNGIETGALTLWVNTAYYGRVKAFGIFGQDPSAAAGSTKRVGEENPAVAA
jgi:radical SAM superfamily enzyme YgiQ (UPF0313 family)